MTLVLTSQAYLREVREAFQEIEAVDVSRLTTKLVIYEDELAELLDQYNPYNDEGPYCYTDIEEHLLDLWRTTLRIRHIRERILLSSFEIPSFPVHSQSEDNEMQGMMNALSDMRVQ